MQQNTRVDFLMPQGIPDVQKIPDAFSSLLVYLQQLPSILQLFYSGLDSAFRRDPCPPREVTPLTRQC